MAKKEIYNQGSSACDVEFDGDVLTITQTITTQENGTDHKTTNSVTLYPDELTAIVAFIKESEVT